MEITKSLEFYLKELIDKNSSKVTNDFLSVKLLKSIKKFLTLNFKLNRKKKINNLLKTLSENKILPDIKIDYLKEKQIKAYMTDDFKLYISEDYLKKASKANLIITLIHEIAHLYLAHQENYQDLLDLDNLFFSKIEKNKETILISPVEYYADKLTFEVLYEYCANTTKNNISKNIMETLKEKQNDILDIIQKYIEK